MAKYTGYVEGGDGLKTLLPEDDPATVIWGKKWRTPTREEFEELLDGTKCKWEWTEEYVGCTVRPVANF